MRDGAGELEGLNRGRKETKWGVGVKDEGEGKE